MQRPVVVFLWVGHPHHRIDSRQDRLDPRTVLRFHRVDVGQIQDRHRPKVVPVMFADIVDTEPRQERFERYAVIRRDPGNGPAGGRPPNGRQADYLTGERVEQARLADAGSPDQGQDVGVGRKAGPS